jgi:hypothetical protein
MQIQKGDIWVLAKSGGGWVVIPTNTGWKHNGDNVMGRGLARQAADKFPSLPTWYGDRCQELNGCPVVLPYVEALLMYPTKYNPETPPHLQWRNPSRLEVVKSSAVQLRQWATMALNHRLIYLPLVGCGNGQLGRGEVMPILEEYLDLPNIILVEQ